MALCGGYQEFSFTGGTATDPSIVLRHPFTALFKGRMASNHFEEVISRAKMAWKSFEMVQKR